MASGDTILEFEFGNFVPDDNETMEAGVGPATVAYHSGLDRVVWAMDDTAEEGVVSRHRVCPQHYGGGGLTAYVTFYMASDNTNDVAFDLRIEAITPGSDTLDLEATESFDTANSFTISLSGSTAGDAIVVSSSLSNIDSIAAGDIMRVALMRDCDDAGDDASGDLYFATLELRET
jgi:hypothetical protein